MSSNIHEFEKELNLAGARTEDDIVQWKKLIAMEALKRIINKNPIDTGRSRGNWQVGLEELDGEDWQQDPLTAGLMKINALKDYEYLYIFNNVHYVIYLEEGSSQQAPNGMVAITLEELEEVFK